MSVHAGLRLHQTPPKKGDGESEMTFGLRATYIMHTDEGSYSPEERESYIEIILSNTSKPVFPAVQLQVAPPLRQR